MDKLEKITLCFSCCKKLDCDNCPYEEEHLCAFKARDDALELLKEQQAEIERLKYELNQYHKADTFLAVHGWQWKDDGTEHYTEQLKDGEQE